MLRSSLLIASLIPTMLTAATDNTILSEEFDICLAGRSGSLNIERQIIIDVELVKLTREDGLSLEVVFDPMGTGTYSKFIDGANVGGSQLMEGDDSIKKYLTIFHGDRIVWILRSHRDPALSTWIYVTDKSTNSGREVADLVDSLSRCR